ncbi:nuclear transport factor 2 family protein [Streptomyces sp. AK02-01A]|uniref:nuclear transport factor 2 family protein n=1 Tax=Streptomyces sp. AK02-01A TaxID=3028648 RepID=UPI0029BF9707|nr:nuclear transport factor 2 family protein [Streptomyces sp. AK02-01A]MDX3853083.1 nuclear transport factor 2 family protein [Streptomyces sp. AK02-01A]
MSSSSTLPQWFSRALDSLWARDLDGFTSIFAPDALYEIPFTPTGPVRLEGREEIGTFMRGLLDGGRLRYGSLTEVRAYETQDDLIVEAVARHHRSADGSPLDLSYIWFVTRQDGQVSRFRDYMNPLEISAI